MVLINIPNISMIAFIYLDSDLLVNCPIIFSHYFTPLIATLSKVPVAFCKDGINKSHYFCDEQHLELSTVGRVLASESRVYTCNSQKTIEISSRDLKECH